MCDGENSFIYPYNFEQELKNCSPFHLPIYKFDEDTINLLSKNNEKSNQLKNRIIEIGKKWEGKDFNEYMYCRSLNKNLNNQKLSNIFDDFVEEKKRNPNRNKETIQEKLEQIKHSLECIELRMQKQ